MKVTSLGYDPTLGAKFAKESKGLVIGRARSSQQSLEKQAEKAFVEEHGRAPDPQELHDQMAALSRQATSSEVETEADGPRAAALRIAKIKHQAAQYRKK